MDGDKNMSKSAFNMLWQRAECCKVQFTPGKREFAPLRSTCVMRGGGVSKIKGKANTSSIKPQIPKVTKVFTSIDRQKKDRIILSSYAQ